MGTVKSFNTQIELIQWIEGDCIYKEFLDQGREGFHHIAISVDDTISYINFFKQIKIEVLQSGRMAKLEYTYLDTEKTFGVIIELHELVKRKKMKK